MSEILQQFKEFSAGIEGKHADLATSVERALRRLDAMEAEGTRRGGPLAIKSVGQQFLESSAFLEMKGRGWRGNASMPHPKGTWFPHELKTTITSDAVGSSTPGILRPERLGGIVKPGVQSFRVRDLMMRVPTGNNAVEVVKENVFTNAASPTAETISKPESALTFTIDHAPVKTLAHWVPSSLQILDDFVGLRSYLDMRLMEGLMDIEDYELLAGSGSGQHLSGLSIEATAYDTARNVSGDTYIDKLNHAISQIEDVKLRATGIILHPRDWRAIQLTKEEVNGANTGHYLLGEPTGNAQPYIWGLPVATTTAVTRGQFYVGAFSTHCVIADRMQARIDVSTEHADMFVRNMCAIRCEERIAFLVLRSDSVVYGSF